MTARLLFLVSGRGSNFQSFVDHISLGVLERASIQAVVSNHKGARALDLAREANIPVFDFEGVAGVKFASREDREKCRQAFDNACLQMVKDLRIDYVVLAGFDQIFTKEFVNSLAGRIINIHPAYDLRTFGGRNMVGGGVHRAVLSNSVSYSGCTVHFVSAEIDQGPAILKRRVPIVNEESPESLEEKILKQEHVIYPMAVQLLIDGRVILSQDGRTCYVDSYSNNWDINWWKRQVAYLNLKEHGKEFAI